MAVETKDLAPEEAPEEEIDPELIDESNGKVRASVPVPNPQEQAAKKPKKS